MFEYKGKDFYTNYFNSLEDFELVQEFDLSKDDDERNLYVGMIKAKECIHPLSIRVEIPVTFPHNKLVFRTLSLLGYPHLIHTGKTKYGDWFCLNTPFGETAENQLELEIYRLREWIKRQLKEELPANIKDPKFTAALLKANAYEWENVDEINELRKDALLTLLGDLASEISTEKNIGYLHCIKTEDQRFYAVSNKDISNYELPYVIIDDFPSDSKTLTDVIALSKEYKWDDSVLKHILPNLNLTFEWQDTHSGRYKHKEYPEGYKPSKEERIANMFGESYDETKALQLLTEVRESLDNEDCKLKVEQNNKVSICSISENEKYILRDIIDNYIAQVKRDHGYPKKEQLGPSLPDILNNQLTPEQEAQLEAEQEAEDHYYKYQYGFHSFALGIRQKEGITWLLCQTNIASTKCETKYVDVGICWSALKRPYACGLNYSLAQTIEDKQFFGRGMFSDSLRNKKIAIVGLGAIGSMVAESLARSGITAIGLWDNDLVEPGNICRSTFRIQDVGENKGRAIKKHLSEINPFVKIEEIKAAGTWYYKSEYDVNECMYTGGSFYDNINYDSQENAISKIADYDMIIDCTGSNELLHFISYAVPDKNVVSLCITNHAQNLLMFSSRDGNPFELRKAYLSKIEQDTKNFYLEGTGCYSPTFLATNSSIAALVNMAVGNLNNGIEANNLHSVIYSYDKRGVIAEQLVHYKLKGYDITMTISSETLMDGEDVPEAEDGNLGFVFGCYSTDGKQVMVTHIATADHAKEQLEDAFQTSKGIIDYIGDFVYSRADANTFAENALATIASKAENPNINTNNPLLAVRNPEGTLSFFLYINGELVPFENTHA